MFLGLFSGGLWFILFVYFYLLYMLILFGCGGFVCLFRKFSLILMYEGDEKIKIITRMIKWKNI